jgi:hypothetical protein
MILLIIVIAGVAVFCFLHGYILVGILALAGLSKKYGWPALVFCSLFLFVKNHPIVAIIPLLLIGWNLLGLRLFGTNQSVGAETDKAGNDVRLNFLNYCRDYLVDRAGLSRPQAELLVLDPDLGRDLDEAKPTWLLKDLGVTVDPDAFLVPKLYDATEMHRINVILDKYAAEYAGREEGIRDYLKSIGHPLEEM